MPTVLALIALHGRAGLQEFDAYHQDPAVKAFGEKVVMELDEEIDAAYPQRWIGKVLVETIDGKQYAARIDEPKGDPGNTLTRRELEDKALRLGRYRGGASEAEMRALIAQAWRLAEMPAVGALLPQRPAAELAKSGPRSAWRA